MSQPKALLCILGDRQEAGVPEETLLRAAGFAVAGIHWKELAGERRDWTQLVPILEDRAVQAWVVVGAPGDFDAELRCRMALLTLALHRPPATACVLTESGPEPEFPELLEHVAVHRGNLTFAAKLMVARLKARPVPAKPFHATAHLSPLVGAWLEVGPPPGETWNGFMVGAVGAEVVAFGVGPRGVPPQKTVLQHPIHGIKGEWGGEEFGACAARNPLDGDSACFFRVEGSPRAVFVTGYPEEAKTADTGEQWALHLDLV